MRLHAIRVALSGLWFVLLGCCRHTPVATMPEVEARAVIEGYHDALVAGDARAALAMWHPDALSEEALVALLRDFERVREVLLADAKRWLALSQGAPAPEESSSSERAAPSGRGP